MISTKTVLISLIQLHYICFVLSPIDTKFGIKALRSEKTRSEWRLLLWKLNYHSNRKLLTACQHVISPVKLKFDTVTDLGERNWRENEWRGEFDQSDSILFVCQRRENFSSSNSIIVYISHEFYIKFPAAYKYP